MATSFAANLEPEVVKPGSSSLKLFSYSLEAEFQASSSPAASRVFRNLDISICIVTHLTPDGDTKSLHPYADISIFGRICTATYPTAMTVLYRSVPHVPLLWSVLVDRKGMLGYGHVANLTGDPVMFGYILKYAYSSFTRELVGESVESYKLRRFFFICAQVQVLWAEPRTLTPALCTFLMDHLPYDRDFLFPALKMVYWVEKDREEPKLSLRSLPITVPAFQTFRPAALRYLDFEIHDLSAPLYSLFGEMKAIGRIEEVIAYLTQTFPNIYIINLCICRPDYGTNPFSRMVVNKINDLVLRTTATMNTPDVPMPYFPATGQWMSYGIKENFTVDVVTAKGRTSLIDPTALQYFYPDDHNHIFSTLTLMSPLSFVLSYNTNMTLAMVTERTAIVEILSPYIREPNLQHLTLHLQAVAIPLLPRELMQVCANWRQLRSLNFHFRVNRERIEHMPTVETVRSLLNYCPLLEHIYLPEFNLLGFRRAIPGLQAFSLRTLTSIVLYSCDDEAIEVATALLYMFPNLTNVMTEGLSASGWDVVAKAINRQLYDAPGDHAEHTALRLVGGLAAPFVDNVNRFHPGAQVRLHNFAVSRFLRAHGRPR